MIECIFNQTKLIKDGILLVDELRDGLLNQVNDEAEWLAITTEVFNTCHDLCKYIYYIGFHLRY